MQFETIVMTGFALAVPFFLFIRRQIIQDMKRENAALQTRVDKLANIADRQRTEINKLMDVAQAERRARQMSTLSSQKPAPAPPRPTVAEQQEKATRRRFDQSSSANKWDDTTHLTSSPANVAHLEQSIAQLQAGLAQPRELVSGGTFDGGGASGDYGKLETSCSGSLTNDSAPSTSSDSGASSTSSDSGGSCGSSD